jgi:cyclic-di-GMP-binding biofilm dispersal mediator protein
MIDVNVKAPYFAAVEAARQMPDGGRILVIGSTNGDRMPFAGGAAYALSKSAIQGMVRGLARDFGPRGITVNVIQPGPVDTDMNPASGPMADMMHGFMAIGRHIHASEIADYAAFLASPSAAMITGSLQTIDGGFGA